MEDCREWVTGPESDDPDEGSWRGIGFSSCTGNEVAPPGEGIPGPGWDPSVPCIVVHASPTTPSDSVGACISFVYMCFIFM